MAAEMKDTVLTSHGYESPLLEYEMLCLRMQVGCLEDGEGVFLCFCSVRSDKREFNGFAGRKGTNHVWFSTQEYHELGQVRHKFRCVKPFPF